MEIDATMGLTVAQDLTVARTFARNILTGWTAFLLLLVGSLLIGCDANSPDGDVSGEAESPGGSVWGAPIPRDASLREILQHPDIFQRTARVSQFLESAGPDQLEDITYEFRTAALDRGDIEYALFGAWWARFDPESAYLFADGEIRMEQPRVIAEILRTWAYMDPDGLTATGAFQKSSNQLRGMESYLVDSVVVGWFESGRPGLDEFVLSQTDSEVRQTALQAWVRMRVLRDGDLATLEWTQSVDYHARTKRVLLAGALSLIAHQNPQLSVEWLEKAKNLGIDTATFVPRIANAWAHHDPRAAMEWILGFPDTPERKRSVSHISRRWRQRDVLGMKDWLETQPDALDPKAIGQLRYQVLISFVEQNDYRIDWTEMIRWAGLIQGQNRRNISVVWLLKHWYFADPSAAQSWIDSNPYELPEVVLEGGKLLGDKEREKMETALGVSSEA